MKSIVALLLCVLMSATNAQSRPWNDEEKLLGTIALSLHATDIAQTSYAMRHGYHELNPILGRHPHEDKLAGFFILTSLAGYYLLDSYDEHRKVSLYFIIGAKTLIVSRHVGMGLKVRF